MKPLILTLLCAAAAFAQPVTKLVTLKYADPAALQNVIRTFGVDYNWTNKSVALRGSPEAVSAAELALKQLDVSPKNIELVVHFLVGSNQPAAGAIPADLVDVVKQLRATFAFKEYSLLDSLTLRTRAGSSADTTGIVSPPTSSSPRLTQFSIRAANVSEDGTIRIDRMHAGLRIPVVSQSKVDYLNTGIDQDVDVKEGQKVVVGRASLEGPEKALFLVLTAKVVQ